MSLTDFTKIMKIVYTMTRKIQSRLIICTTK